MHRRQTAKSQDEEVCTMRKKKSHSSELTYHSTGHGRAHFLVALFLTPNEVINNIRGYCRYTQHWRDAEASPSFEQVPCLR